MPPYREFHNLLDFPIVLIAQWKVHILREVHFFKEFEDTINEIMFMHNFTFIRVNHVSIMSATNFTTQQTFTCSKSIETIETLEKGVNYVKT